MFTAGPGRPAVVRPGAVVMAMCVLLATGALAAPAGAAPAVSVDLAFALDGGVRAQRSAEVRVRLSAQRETAARLELHGAALPVFVELRLLPGKPSELWLPLASVSDGPLQARVHAGGQVAGEARVWPTRTGGARDRVVAVAATDPPEVPGDVRAVGVSTQDLPRNAAGYGAVSMLVLDAPALARLDLHQRRALERYLADCGPVLVQGLRGEAVRALIAGAGCSGELFAAVPGPGLAAGVLPTLLARAARGVPDRAALAALEAPRATAGVGVAVFIVAYACLALLAAVALSAAWALALPLAAAALAVVVWTGGSPAGGMHLWLEQDVGAVARGTGHIEVIGRGRAQAAWPLPDGLLPSGPSRGSAGVVHAIAHESAGAGGAGVLRVPARLLSRTRMTLAGTLATGVGAMLTMHRGSPQVSNPGEVGIAGAVLLWQGRALRVPRLAPGARWSAHGTTVEVAGPAVRLALARTPADRASLLLPLDPSHNVVPGWTAASSAGEPELRGWLLLHAAPGPSGAGSIPPAVRRR